MYIFKSLLFTLTFLFGLSALAGATTPYPFVEVIDNGMGQEVSLFILPDGSGPAFTHAQIDDGTFVDATIRLWLITEYFSPIAYFPWEDIWLEDENGGMSPCALGFCADGVSNPSGMVVFSSSLAGGGWSEGPIHVYVAGNPAYDPSDYPYYWAHAPLALRFNSADINGDNEVNLADVALFSSDFFGTYHYRSDFHWDGHIDLNDVARMAGGLGHNCP